jgi:hypothetical protein
MRQCPTTWQTLAPAKRREVILPLPPPPEAPLG